jgi:fatty-acyl-CoA synthase
MLAHPAVGNAAAVGQPDAYAGELPVVFVSLKAGASATEAELLAFAAPRVQEPAACPKRAWILAALPLTPIGKIFKPALREIATRQAMHDAIAKAGIASEQYSIEAATKKMIVRIRAGASVEVAKKALTGMPAAYDVVAE